jgi:hypothetical protein
MGKKRDKEETIGTKTKLIREILPLTDLEGIVFELDELEKRLEMQTVQPDAFGEEGTGYTPGCQADGCDQVCSHCEEINCSCYNWNCGAACETNCLGRCDAQCLADCEFCVGDW